MTMTTVFDGVHDLAWFIGAGLLLNLTPGVDMALVTTRAAAHGFRSGAAAALGVGAGCMLHAAAAALGLSALLAGSATAFTLLRWVGAAYLVWMGLAMLRTRAAAGTATAAATAAPSFARVFLQGFWTNALNPKVALFFLAFVPQFIAADAPHKALAFLALGVVFNVNGTLVNLGFAALAAALRQRAGDGARRLGAWLARGVGALFVLMGLKLAFGSR